MASEPGRAEKARKKTVKKQSQAIRRKYKSQYDRLAAEGKLGAL